MDPLVDGDEVGEAIRQKENRHMRDKTPLDMVSNSEGPDLVSFNILSQNLTDLHMIHDSDTIQYIINSS